MTEIYLDNSATTRCSDEAAKVMAKVLTEDYGNPSSLHNKGMEAENYLKNTRKVIADSLKVDKNEIYFTSGGSESNNAVILGYAAENPKKESMSSRRQSSMRPLRCHSSILSRMAMK